MLKPFLPELFGTNSRTLEPLKLEKPLSPVQFHGFGITTWRGQQNHGWQMPQEELPTEL
jgi:hypothetical protein